MSRKGIPIVAGSAPRGRGTDQAEGSRPDGSRFSPAWAGNGSTDSKNATWATVQPRVGGERIQLADQHDGQRGSAPRGRGPEYPRAEWILLARFSPAWAGNGLTYAGGWNSSTVQPRVGGERVEGKEYPSPLPGSAPRGRGTGPLGWRAQRIPRFSPAWAGNGRDCRRCTQISSVQPRVGGERIWSVAVKGR